MLRIASPALYRGGSDFDVRRGTYATQAISNRMSRCSQGGGMNVEDFSLQVTGGEGIAGDVDLARPYALLDMQDRCLLH